MLYTDSIFWKLPKAYLHGSLPENVNYDLPFGTYSLEYTVDSENHGIWVVRRYKLNGGLFKADQYEEFLNFIREIRRADRSQIILNKV